MEYADIIVEPLPEAYQGLLGVNKARVLAAGAAMTLDVSKKYAQPVRLKFVRTWCSVSPAVAVYDKIYTEGGAHGEHTVLKTAPRQR